MFTLSTQRLLLKLPEEEMTPLIMDYFKRNRNHFAPWGAQLQPE